MSGALLSPGIVPRRRLLLSQAGLRGVFRIRRGFPRLQELKTTDWGGAETHPFTDPEASTLRSGCGRGRLPLQALGPGVRPFASPSCGGLKLPGLVAAAACAPSSHGLQTLAAPLSRLQRALPGSE